MAASLDTLVCSDSASTSPVLYNNCHQLHSLQLIEFLRTIYHPIYLTPPVLRIRAAFCFVAIEVTSIRQFLCKRTPLSVLKSSPYGSNPREKRSRTTGNTATRSLAEAEAGYNARADIMRTELMRLWRLWWWRVVVATPRLQRTVVQKITWWTRNSSFSRF